MRNLLILTASALVLVAGCGKKTEKADPAPTAPVAEAASVAAAARDHLEAMRAQIAVVEMEPETSFLTAEEARIVNLLNEAASLMSEIYRRQVSEENPATRAEIAASDSPDREILLDLFDLHFGPWDSLDEDKPFYGTKPKPAGGAFYPEDMTKEEFEAYVAAHPYKKDALVSGYTVIRRDAGGALMTIPYSEHYREWLEPAGWPGVA